MTNSNEDGCAFIAVGAWLIVVICWIVNLVKLLNCDFEAPFKDEVIHLVGVFVPPVSLITCWF